MLFLSNPIISCHKPDFSIIDRMTQEEFFLMVAGSIVPLANLKGVIFRVDAPAGVLWHIFGAFSHYPRIFDNIDKAKAYKKEQNTQNNGTNYFLQIEQSTLLEKKTLNFIFNLPTKDRDWASWQLDPGQASDMFENSGVIKIIPMPNSSFSSYVYFCSHKVFQKYTPQFILHRYHDIKHKNFAQWFRQEAAGRWQEN